MRIAIVGEDEDAIVGMADILSAHGASCHAFPGTQAFLHALPYDSFDVCILDLDPAGQDGVSLMRTLCDRRQMLPVLILVGEDAPLDLVDGLDSRNDFLLKPVRPAELRARLAALVRRSTPGTARDDLFEYDRFRFDLKTLAVRDRGVDVELTQKEFQLALLLLSNVGKPLSRVHIREAVWGRNAEVPSRTLDTHVSRVRTKLRLRPEAGYLLAPVYSYGYRLENLLEPGRGGADGGSLNAARPNAASGEA